MDPSEFEGYLAECRNLTLAAIREIVPRDARSRSSLYDLILDYPLRQAKALRPALCIATCCALGGRLECVLRSAAVLELYHNAFLIHDDVEDGSEQRREAPTLHCKHGIPIAVNVGDAMLALTLQPLLDNMATVGLGKALRILQVIARIRLVSHVEIGEHKGTYSHAQIAAFLDEAGFLPSLTRYGSFEGGLNLWAVAQTPR